MVGMVVVVVVEVVAVVEDYSNPGGMQGSKPLDTLVGMVEVALAVQQEGEGEVRNILTAGRDSDMAWLVA